MRRSKNDLLTPDLLKKLIHALRENPSLVDAADSCSVHPRTLREWIQKGLLPNPEPHYAALARFARGARSKVRGEMFGLLRKAAKLDPKWAQYLLERMTEPEEMTWTETLAIPPSAVRRHLLSNPSPELLADAHAAGVKIVPLTPEEKQLPAPVVDGELVDPEDL